MRKNRKRATLEAHHVVLRKPDIEFREQTPFEAFMEQLAIRFGDRRSGMGGVGEWVDFPYEEAVADGLWLIFLKAAEQLRVKPTTAHGVMEQVAPHVNRVLNGGFPLCYPTTWQAVESFEQKVVAVANQAAATTSSPSDAWAVPCAKFFAQILAKARKTAQRLTLISTRVYKLNQVTIPGWTKITYLPIGKGFDPLHDHTAQPREAELLTLGAQITDGPFENYRQPVRQNDYSTGVAAFEAEGYEDLRKIRALSQLPFRLSGVPEDARMLDLVIEDHWLKTQALLASAGAPLEQEYLRGAEYHSALQAFQQQEDEQIIDGFRRRMLARDPTLDRDALEMCVDMLRTELGGIRLWDSRILDLYVKQQLLISLGSDQDFAALDEKSREQVQADLEEGAPTIVSNEVVTLLQKKVVWKKVRHFGYLEGLYQDGIVPLKEIIENLPLCSKTVRAEAREYLFQYAVDLQDDEQACAVELGFLPLQVEWLLSHPELYSVETCLAALPTLYEKAHRQSGYSEAMILPGVVKLLASLAARGGTTHPLARVLNDPANRSFIWETLTAALPNQSQRIQELRKLLRQHLSFDDWCLHVLGSEVRERHMIFSQEKQGATIPRWAELHKPQQLQPDDPRTLDLPALLGVSRNKLRDILTSITEEKAFLWTFAEERGVAKDLKRFLKLRDQYYRTMT